MPRLIAVTNYRLPFAQQVQQLQGQRQWLIDLEHLLDPEQLPAPTSHSVLEAVDTYLRNLLTMVRTNSDPTDQTVAAHINKMFHSFWWGLFVCYDVEGLPRTNNELERFIRQIKTGQRRVSGRKNVHDFVIRYGSYVAFIDYCENEADLFARLQLVSHQDFLLERQSLNFALLQEQKKHRFRHHRPSFLSDLEHRWADAVLKSNS